MKAQTASGRQATRERWANGLLWASVLVYGGGAVLLMAALGSGAVGWWLLGSVAGLVTLGFLVGTAPARLSLRPLWRRRCARDEWAKLWDGLMRRPVR